MSDGHPMGSIAQRRHSGSYLGTRLLVTQADLDAFAQRQAELEAEATLYWTVTVLILVNLCMCCCNCHHHHCQLHLPAQKELAHRHKRT